jgi:hypothetical protein
MLVEFRKDRCVESPEVHGEPGLLSRLVSGGRHFVGKLFGRGAGSGLNNSVKWEDLADWQKEIIKKQQIRDSYELFWNVYRGRENRDVPLEELSNALESPVVTQMLQQRIKAGEMATQYTLQFDEDPDFFEENNLDPVAIIYKTPKFKGSPTSPKEIENDTEQFPKRP